MEIMVEAGKAHPRVLADPPPVGRLMSFGDNGINLEVRVWMIDPEGGVGSIRSDVNMAIWKSFKEEGITIPFPQRDLHMIDKSEFQD